MFDQEFIEDSDGLIRSTQASFFIPGIPSPPYSHPYSIPIGRELLRKGPRKPYVKKASPGLLQLFHRLVFEKNYQKFSNFLWGQEILSSNEMNLYHIKQTVTFTNTVNVFGLYIYSVYWRVSKNNDAIKI